MVLVCNVELLSSRYYLFFLLLFTITGEKPFLIIIVREGTVQIRSY